MAISPAPALFKGGKDSSFFHWWRSRLAPWTAALFGAALLGLLLLLLVASVLSPPLSSSSSERRGDRSGAAGVNVASYEAGRVPQRFRHARTNQEDVFISVKTTQKFHRVRLGVILETWFQLARRETWFFTDKADRELSEATSKRAFVSDLGGMLI